MRGQRAETEEHRPPTTCPVCGSGMVLTRLGCRQCGTEIGGEFRMSEFDALDDDQLGVLRVFLASRGNLREVARHLGVSYPTARARLTDVLVRLGLAGEADEDADLVGEEMPADDATEGPLTRAEVIDRVAAGTLTPEEAAEIITAQGL